MNISKTAAKMIETTRNAMVKGQNGNLQNTLADPQIKLWTAEEIAKYLGMSLSFVYAHISKEKPVLEAGNYRERFGGTEKCLRRPSQET